ncbi:acyl carrier protein [Algoriella xinjiangensis]|uniref:Acyl carrier protein n=1 Tax=Algoriella xinjiangensis TaxID=684065 RepID=A0A1I4X970_9FLAO|nr:MULTISPECIES: phosphopantetheine-binding protein [Algoriella]MBO6212137.1 acyl carrier protein [Algoriella sp.]SFN21789.1 acyl carrier protein [Algoriella xinjiangensis]VDH14776.1 Acyl carrier protein AcpP [Algoriella xinjiangensis]
MVKSKIAEKLNTILIDEFEVDPTVISEEKNVKESLDLDSLDYVDLVVVIESNFGVKLVKEDFQNIITFEDFYAILEQKLENI